MNFICLKLYSSWLDKVKHISIRSTWGLNWEEEKKKKHEIEKINQGSELEGYMSIQVDWPAKNITIKEDRVLKPQMRSKIRKNSCISNWVKSLLLSNNCSSESNLLTKLAYQPFAKSSNKVVFLDWSVQRPLTRPLLIGWTKSFNRVTPNSVYCNL